MGDHRGPRRGQARIENTLACDAELRLRARKVLRVISSGVKPVLRLRTALGHEIFATAEHPFMTMAGWRQLGKLKIGDYVATARSLPVARLVRSEVYWDRIVAIEPVGDRETYDLKIEGDHNFVANHFIVHNSHAASFALLVYTSAWLKHHEPAAFCAALINSQPMGFYAPAQLVRDARAHGVEVRPVAVRGQRMGLHARAARRRPPGAAAGVAAGEAFVAGRARTGWLAARAARPFADVADLAERAALDRRDLEALAAADALAGLARASPPRRMAGERRGAGAAAAAGGYRGP